MNYQAPIESIIAKGGSVICDKTQDEPLRVTDRGAGRMTLTIGRVKGEGVVDCKVE